MGLLKKTSVGKPCGGRTFYFAKELVSFYTAKTSSGHAPLDHLPSVSCEICPGVIIALLSLR